jgi:esterase
MRLNFQQKQPVLNKAGQIFENIFVIHGLFGSLSNLSGVSTALQEEHQVISVDLRNHGLSPHSPNMSYLEMASDIFELANHLNIENFSIIGHSMGGKVAMTCALQHPERINKLVIVDIAPVAYENKHQDVFTGLQALSKQPINSRKAADSLLSAYIRSTETRQFLLKSLFKNGKNYQLRFNLAAIKENYNAIRGWIEVDTVFNKKTLFIKGADSDYILPQHETEILRLFPKAKAKVLSNTGHWLHVEKANTFNRLVTRFFKQT